MKSSHILPIIQLAEQFVAPGETEKLHMKGYMKKSRQLLSWRDPFKFI